MRSALERNQVTHAQTVDENLNGMSAGTYEVEADNSAADTLASLEVVLHWLGAAVAVAFIGLAIIEPVRVERTLTSLMFKARDIQISDVGWAAERVERTLTSLVFKARDIQIADVGWAAVEMAKSDDRIRQIDAEHKFEVIDSPPQVADDFDQRSQSQTDITGSGPIPTSSAAESIDIDQSLAIEFPTAAYEPHKSADAIKRHPLPRAKHPPERAKVAAKRSVSTNPQTNSGANSNYSKPIEPNSDGLFSWIKFTQPRF
jgi:hypothetical protein